MAKCCDNIWLNTIIGTPPDLGGGGDPPVLSEYCVQWTVVPTSICFPCTNANDVNGSFSANICGGVVEIPDLNGIVGNNFVYDHYSSGFWYAQVIRPQANAALVDLGYYAYECFGFPFGPIPIDITEENCFVNCYTATFDVESVATDGFTSVNINDPARNKDMFFGGITPFDDPTAASDILTELIARAYVEPSATVEVIINSPTNVTLNICTIMVLYTGGYGDDIIDKGTFNFTLV